MRVLFDTNIILDVLLDRQPWAAEGRRLWTAARDGQFEAFVTASSLTDLFYLSRRHSGRERAWDVVRSCLDDLYVIGVSIIELRSALNRPGIDFEDNLQIACAESAVLDFIITRDHAGLVSGTIPVLTTAEFLSRITTS